jgi:hypothetical protein
MDRGWWKESGKRLNEERGRENSGWDGWRWETLERDGETGRKRRRWFRTKTFAKQSALGSNPSQEGKRREEGGAKGRRGEG